MTQKCSAGLSKIEEKMAFGLQFIEYPVNDKFYFKVHRIGRKKIFCQFRDDQRPGLKPMFNTVSP